MLCIAAEAAVMAFSQGPSFGRGITPRGRSLLLDLDLGVL